jgi:hypothetical protein
VDAKTLPELQLWLGDSGLGFGAQLNPAAKPCSGSSEAFTTSSAASAAGAAAEREGGITAADNSSGEQQQQQQHKWLEQLAQHTVSFAGSFLAGPGAKPQDHYFSYLGVLTVSNLSRADGPWEPSVVLGDQLLAAVAFGCPALKTLEVRRAVKP